MSDGVNIEAKKRYICDHQHDLGRESFLDVGRLLIHGGAKEHIKEGSDGCRIDLNKLSENMINQIYSLIQRRLGEV